MDLSELLAPDPVIERYKQDVDRTLIRENLKKSYEERLLTLERMQAFVAEVRAAGEEIRRRKMTRFRALLEAIREERRTS